MLVLLACSLLSAAAAIRQDAAAPAGESFEALEQRLNAMSVAAGSETNDVTFMGMKVETEKAGELAALLGDNINMVDSLVVTGPINDDDIYTMWSASRYGYLSVLDLKGATMEGGRLPDNAFFRYKEQVVDDRIYVPCLRKIILPDGLTAIGETAFYFCIYLEEVVFPESLTELGEACFASCRRLKTNPLRLPEGITVIPQQCFHDCWQLKKIELPSTIRSIERFAFFLSSITEINFPEGLQNIGDLAFHYTKLEEVVLPESCAGLTGQGHFEVCYNLLRIQLPSGLTSIPSYFLEGNMNLQAIDLPEGMTKIGEYGLNGCSSLTQLVLPSTMETLGRACFRDLSSLKAIYSKAIVPPACEQPDGEVPFNNVNTDVPVYIPKGSLAAYKNAPAWSRFSTFIETDSFPTSGVADVTADGSAADGMMYDLSGRPASQPRDGQIYIQKGKKFIYRGE